MIWLTRDTDGEELSDIVIVWGSCPTRYRDSLGAFWSCGTEESLTWHRVETAKRLYRTVPDTDLECIRFEGEARRVPRPKGGQ